MNLNKVFILGRLTADPQLRSTPGGQPVASFGVATNRVWTDKSGQKQESTEFHNVVVWGRQAEVASKFLTKGSLVLVEGRLQTRNWEGKDGQQHRTTEIIAERMQLGPRPMGSGGGRQTAVDSGASVKEVPTIEIGDEEIKDEDLKF